MRTFSSSENIKRASSAKLLHRSRSTCDVVGASSSSSSSSAKGRRDAVRGSVSKVLDLLSPTSSKSNNKSGLIRKRRTGLRKSKSNATWGHLHTPDASEDFQLVATDETSPTLRIQDVTFDEISFSSKPQVGCLKRPLKRPSNAGEDEESQLHPNDQQDDTMEQQENQVILESTEYLSEDSTVDSHGIEDISPEPKQGLQFAPSTVCAYLRQHNSPVQEPSVRRVLAKRAIIEELEGNEPFPLISATSSSDKYPVDKPSSIKSLDVEKPSSEKNLSQKKATSSAIEDSEPICTTEVEPNALEEPAAEKSSRYTLLRRSKSKSSKSKKQKKSSSKRHLVSCEVVETDTAHSKLDVQGVSTDSPGSAATRSVHQEQSSLGADGKTHSSEPSSPKYSQHKSGPSSPVDGVRETEEESTNKQAQTTSEAIMFLPLKTEADARDPRSRRKSRSPKSANRKLSRNDQSVDPSTTDSVPGRDESISKQLQATSEGITFLPLKTEADVPNPRSRRKSHSPKSRSKKQFYEDQKGRSDDDKSHSSQSTSPKHSQKKKLLSSPPAEDAPETKESANKQLQATTDGLRLPPLKNEPDAPNPRSRSRSPKFSTKKRFHEIQIVDASSAILPSASSEKALNSDKGTPQDQISKEGPSELDTTAKGDSAGTTLERLNQAGPSSMLRQDEGSSPGRRVKKTKSLPVMPKKRSEKSKSGDAIGFDRLARLAESRKNRRQGLMRRKSAENDITKSKNGGKTDAIVLRQGSASSAALDIMQSPTGQTRKGKGYIKSFLGN